jgi:hypothetical protein
MGDLIVGRSWSHDVFFDLRWGIFCRVHLKVQLRWWNVYTNSRQDTILMLLSINLPGGVQVSCSVSLYRVWSRADHLSTPQRRNLEGDELQMRQFSRGETW